VKPSRSAFLGAALVALLAVPSPGVRGARDRVAPSPSPAAQAATAAAVAKAAPPANPLLQPQATGVEPEALARPLTAAEKRAMARELADLQTRDAADLVSVIATEAADARNPSLLLSIAHTETRGKVLAVSPAGAAGLAQATPAAFLLEGLDGPLYVDNQYLIGSRAYIMKKPLGDAVGIAEGLLEGETTLEQAHDLLAAAKRLRQVGMDELAALEPVAPAVFAERIRAADAYNADTFDRLERLLDRGAPKAPLTRFRDETRKEYRMLLRLQQSGWKRYADALAGKRDAILRQHYGQDPVKVIRERPYEAGELLGEELDARFSPSRMARFLAAHVETKRTQAVALGVDDDEVEAWTAALYNGGLVNVSRMRAGLAEVGETERYMKKVPELRERLDGAAALAR
jgi:hypothetical protein